MNRWQILKAVVPTSCAYLMLALISTGAASAQNNLYANNAGSTPYVIVMPQATEVASQTVTNLSGSNGRGVVVVSGIMYYTDAGDNKVYSYTLATHTNNGVLFTVAGASALSTMAYDGTNFWIGDYSGTNQAYLYSPTGTLIKTIHLSNCGGSCDGLEYFLQGGTTPRLISNRGDSVGPYDIYDTNGTLITPAFITVSGSSTGIAYDGTNFLVACNFTSICKYNGTTGALISTTAVTGASPGPEIEDLSVDYATTLPITPPTTPAPSSILLMLTALVGLGLFFPEPPLSKIVH